MRIIARSSLVPGRRSRALLLDHMAGGEAFPITALKEGVDSFEWAPDSSRLAVVSRDTEQTLSRYRVPVPALADKPPKERLGRNPETPNKK